MVNVALRENTKCKILVVFLVLSTSDVVNNDLSGRRFDQVQHQDARAAVGGVCESASCNSLSDCACECGLLHSRVTRGGGGGLCR